MLLVAMLAGLAAPGQETVPPTGPSTLPPVEEVAPVTEGVVTLDCRVSNDGRLRDCIVISETPAGQGFGQAALEAASKVRRGAFGADARGGKIRFTTRFQPEDSRPPLT